MPIVRRDFETYGENHRGESRGIGDRRGYSNVGPKTVSDNFQVELETSPLIPDPPVFDAAQDSKILLPTRWSGGSHYRGTD